MLNYLKLIRYKNLLLIAIMQLSFRYGFLKWKNLPIKLTDFEYILLILATIFIAAGGYIINDIMDQETDAINKPKNTLINNSILEDKAYYLYAAFTLIGVCIGFYLSNVIDKPSFAIVFILLSALLYIYSTSIKQIALLGNIVIAFIVAMAILIIGVFDIYPNVTIENQSTMMSYFAILVDYAKFAFIVTLIRELIKDCEDYKGDFANDIKTLPVTIGTKKTNYIIAILLFVAITFIAHWVYNYLILFDLYLATIYMLILVLAPLILCLITIFTTTSSSQYKKLSTILKLVLLFGILSIIIITKTSIQNG